MTGHRFMGGLACAFVTLAICGCGNQPLPSLTGQVPGPTNSPPAGATYIPNLTLEVVRVAAQRAGLSCISEPTSVSGGATLYQLICSSGDTASGFSYALTADYWTVDRLDELHVVAHPVEDATRDPAKALSVLTELIVIALVPADREAAGSWIASHDRDTACQPCVRAYGDSSIELQGSAIAGSEAITVHGTANVQGTSACTTARALVQAGWGGAGGSLAGGVAVTNLGSSACVLAGPPHVELRADGATIEVVTTSYRSVNADQPSEAPPVLLEPGEQAQAPWNWQNWCGGPLTKLEVIVTLPDGSGPAQASYFGPGGQDSETPRCDAPDAPSTLGVFPFQPYS
jgi:uncharacterized protein DUF4232